MNNLLAGSQKAFAHKLEMARAVKKHGYPMVLNFVTHRHNIDNIDQIIRLCIELEADFVELATCQFYGWPNLTAPGCYRARNSWYAQSGSPTSGATSSPPKTIRAN